MGDPSLKEKNHTFQFNVCEPLTSIPKGITVGQNVAITLLGDDGNEISLGKNSSTPILREGGLTLIYKDGDECTVDKVKRKRSAMILFTCIDSLIPKVSPKQD